MWLKACVSGNKKRIVGDGFDLDLTYITNRIVAFGYPAEGFEATYRNSRQDIMKFLLKQHGRMVKIYNLCAENKYQYSVDSLKGYFSIMKVPFQDHNVTSIEKIFKFAFDASLFLQNMEQYYNYAKNNVEKFNKKEQPVIGVHCKAGKGRTGMMICCLILFLDKNFNSKKAIEHYNEKRAINKKALTIKS